MERSGGITAAAIVLILGSGLFALMVVIMILASVVTQAVKEPNPFGPAIFYFEAAFELALAGWGVATAVGILRLRNWARISILVMSGIAVALALFGSLGMFLVVSMMKQDPKMPPGTIAFIVVFEVVLFAIPLAVSVWWLTLFSLKRVRMQFAAATQGAVSQPIAADGMPVASMPDAPGNSARKIPVSIVVIAVFLLLGALSAGFTVPFSIHRHAPFVLFGLLVTGAKAVAAIVVAGALQLIFGIALLRRKPWSLDATVAYAILVTLNGLLFLASRSREVYFKILLSNYQAPSKLPTDFFPHMMRTILPASVAIGILANVVALYFLWTRRRAYRATCASKA